MKAKIRPASRSHGIHETDLVYMNGRYCRVTYTLGNDFIFEYVPWYQVAWYKTRAVMRWVKERVKQFAVTI